MSFAAFWRQIFDFFDFLQIVQAAQDFRPFPVRPSLLQAFFQSAPEQ